MRIVYYALCTAGMVAFWFFIKFMVTGITRDFGLGFGLGMMFMVMLFWLHARVTGKTIND